MNPTLRHLRDLATRLALVSGAVISLTTSLGAQCTQPEDQLLFASDGQSYDRFGAACDLSGNEALIGASTDNTNAGSVYAFHWGGASFTETQHLFASDGAANDYFGSSIAMDGTSAVIGAYGNSDAGRASGSAYVFVFNGTQWVETQKLLASDAASRDIFGSQVAIHGDVILVTAPGDQRQNNEYGSVYVFRRTGSQWNEETKLLPSSSIDDFGIAVATDGVQAVISATFLDYYGFWSWSSVFTFAQSGGTWVEQQQFAAPNPKFRDLFGFALAIDGNRLAVGAPGASSSGSAFLFESNGTQWNAREEIIASGGAANDQMGTTVDLDGAWLVAGAPQASGASWRSGVCYAFHDDGSRSVQVFKGIAQSSSTSDRLAGSIAIDGGRLLAGAERATGRSGNTGSAYFFAANGLSLTADPASVSANQLLTLTTCGGLAVTPRLLAVVALNGVPLFLVLDRQPFAADGTAVLSGNVPPGLSGTTISLVAIGFWQPGALAMSNTAAVTFL